MKSFFAGLFLSSLLLFAASVLMPKDAFSADMAGAQSHAHSHENQPMMMEPMNMMGEMGGMNEHIHMHAHSHDADHPMMMEPMNMMGGMESHSHSH